MLWIACGSVQIHPILVWKVGMQARPTLTQPRLKTHHGDHFRAHIPISTFSNHSLYILWEIERVELMWIVWINPIMLNLAVKRRGMEPKLSPPATQKPWYGDGYTEWIQISTIAQPFIILILRHLNGWDDTNCLDWSKVTQSWCEILWKNLVVDIFPWKSTF